MTFYQLVFRNIYRNPRIYLSYFVSSIFSVFMFFVGALLFFHPSLQGEYLDGNTRWTSVTYSFPPNFLFGLSLLVIAILAFVFLGVMFRLFLKERQANFDMYLIIGMKMMDLKKMLALENSIIGSVSTIVGTFCGIIFSKLFLLISQNMLASENSLVFYFPWEAILLTLITYGVVFFAITLVTISLVKSRQTNMSLNLQEKQFRTPRSNRVLSIIGPILILVAILCFIFFVKKTTWEWMTPIFQIEPVEHLFFIPLIILCLLFGTFYTMTNSLVSLLLFLRNRPKVIKSKYLLSLSNLVYRVKENSVMYFLIVVSSTLAFTIITVTLLMSDVQLYGTQGDNSLAYTYRAYSIKTKEDLKFHEENIAFISKTIHAKGYQTLERTSDFDATIAVHSKATIPGFYDRSFGFEDSRSKIKGPKKLLFLLPVSEFNEAAEFNKTPKLRIDYSDEIVILTSPIESTTKQFKGNSEFIKNNVAVVRPITFRFSKERYNAGMSLANVAVASDELYQEVKLANENQLALDKEAPQTKEQIEDTVINIDNIYDFPMKVIHYREWAKSPDVDKKIREFFTRRQDEIFENINDAEKEYDPETDESTFFEYTSLYQTMLQKKQENGATILVSILVGSVFFIFSAGVVYLRVFGELSGDSGYHRTLHLLGTPEEQRHKLITYELLLTFFLPVLVALVIYFVLVFGMMELFNLKIIHLSGWICGLFLLVQFSFFIIARRKYIRNIDNYLEKWQRK